MYMIYCSVGTWMMLLQSVATSKHRGTRSDIYSVFKSTYVHTMRRNRALSRAHVMLFIDLVTVRVAT